MKTVLVIFFLALLAAGFIYFNRATVSEEYRNINVGENTLRVKIAKTPADRELGLQNVTSIRPDEGMLFVFENPNEVAFWNKNTLLDLDLIWINNFQVVGVGSLPKEPGRGRVTINSPEKVNFVIEVSAGWANSRGVKIGDIVPGY